MPEPAQRYPLHHAGGVAQRRGYGILVRRHHTYAEAKDRNPRRWSRETRDLRPVGAVQINPEKQPRDSTLARVAGNRLRRQLC